MDKRPAGGVRGMEGGGVPVPRAISGFRTAAEVLLSRSATRRAERDAAHRQQL